MSVRTNKGKVVEHFTHRLKVRFDGEERVDHFHHSELVEPSGALAHVRHQNFNSHVLIETASGVQIRARAEQEGLTGDRCRAM